MAFARLNNTSMHYQLEGPQGAPVVVLSNSLGTDFAMWDAQMDALTAEFRVLRYDTRGHGRSVGGEGPYTLDDLGGDVVELLDHLQLQRVHVCGVSLGGLTALWLALHARERIVGIMPCNTAARLGSHAGWAERIAQVDAHGLESIAQATMSRWFTDRFRERNPSEVDRTRRMLCSTNAMAYSWCCAALQGADLRERLAEIDVACLVVSGTHDPVTPPADGLYLRDHIAECGYVELNAAHLSNIEDAVEFSRVLGEFLRQ